MAKKLNKDLFKYSKNYGEMDVNVERRFLVLLLKIKFI